MQVVSGAIGKQKIHYQPPKVSLIESEMEKFFEWINTEYDTDLIIRAGIAHLWFITNHPFEDGNGRIARAITDMILAKSDGIAQRFYSISSQIQKVRKEYYDIIEKIKKEILILQIG